MKILGNIKFFIRAEKRFSRFVALPVLIVPPYIPHRIRTIGGITEIIGNVGDDKLRFCRNIVDLKILEIIVV